MPENVNNIDTPIMPVATLTAKAIDDLNFQKDAETQTLNLQSFFHLQSPAATESYIAHLRKLATQCHADGIRLLAHGGEAVVFDLYRHGKPLHAVIRMEHANMPDRLDQYDGEDMESPGVNLEEFGLAFDPYSTRLPAYFEEILTTREDTEQQGVHFKISPQIFPVSDFIDMNLISEEQFIDVLYGLQKRAIADGLDTDEMLREETVVEENLGVYLSPSGQVHLVYLDPGNMLHMHNLSESTQIALRERTYIAMHTDPKRVKDGDALSTELAKEVNEDATRLFEGKPTRYSEFLEGITYPQMQRSWQDFVRREEQYSDRER